MGNYLRLIDGESLAPGVDPVEQAFVDYSERVVGDIRSAVARDSQEVRAWADGDPDSRAQAVRKVLELCGVVTEGDHND